MVLSTGTGSRIACTTATVLALGCGGSSPSTPRSASETSGNSQAPSQRAADTSTVTMLAATYLEAFAARDYAAVCRTRLPSERRELARTAGSCERAFGLIVRARPGVDRIFANARVGDVRFRGDVAGADVIQPGQDEPATTLAAVKRRGSWYLADFPEQRTP